MIEGIKINSVPHNIIFPDSVSPLAKYGGGGVSGKIAQPVTWAFAKRLREMTRVPVVVPSIWDFEDLTTVRTEMKFEADSFGSVFLPYPWRPTLYVRKFEQETTKGVS